MAFIQKFLIEQIVNIYGNIGKLQPLKRLCLHPLKQAVADETNPVFHFSDPFPG